MDLRHLKYFLMVADEGNLSRAASKLHISQPPLTRQIKQLENDLDTTLFIRSREGMELTEAGKLFYEEASNILSVVDLAVDRTQRTAQGKYGRLDVGIFGSGIFNVIPLLLGAFRDKYPDVKVALHCMDKSTQIQALRQKRITVGFNRIITQRPDIESRLITTEKLLLAIRTNHEFTRKGKIKLQHLSQIPLILYPYSSRPSLVDRVIELCRNAGFSPEISHEIDDVVTGIALVSGGFGGCIVPESASTLSMPNVTYLPISDMPHQADIDLSCIYRANDDSAILKSFLETLSECQESNIIN